MRAPRSVGFSRPELHCWHSSPVQSRNDEIALAQSTGTCRRGRFLSMPAEAPRASSSCREPSVATPPHIHSKSLERRQAFAVRSPCHDSATVSQCANGGIREGAGMATIVDELLLFSCLVAFVWGSPSRLRPCSSRGLFRHVVHFMPGRHAGCADRAGRIHEGRRI